MLTRRICFQLPVDTLTIITRPAISTNSKTIGNYWRKSIEDSFEKIKKEKEKKNRGKQELGHELLHRLAATAQGTDDAHTQTSFPERHAYKLPSIAK